MPKSETRKYILEAITRIESGEVKPGSHLAGVFGKAGANYETELRAKLDSTLLYCRIDYDPNIKGQINGPIFKKLTLGQILACFKELERTAPQCLGKCFRSGTDFAELFDQVDSVNKKWVAVKHGHGSIDLPEAVQQMKNMLTTFEAAEI